MVLVKHEIPVRARVPQNQGNSNASASASAEGSSVRVPLPQAAYESTFQVELHPSVEPILPHGLGSPAGPQSYQKQLMLLEQQNKKRLLMARQEAEERRQSWESNKRATGKEELNAASREDYHLQQMAVEHENGKRLMGARQQLAAHTSGSRNQGHDAHASVGGYEHMDPMTQISQLRLLEQQNKRRLEQARQHYGCEVSGRSDWDEGYKQDEDAAKQTEASRLASQSPPTQAEDKWGKGPFPAGQGVISGYQVQLMALDNRRKEEAAARSQTEVEFSQQRRRYLAEEAEMSRLSGQQLPGAPGSSCAPPGYVYGHPLAFRPAPRPDAGFNDLYDN